MILKWARQGSLPGKRESEDVEGAEEEEEEEA